MFKNMYFEISESVNFINGNMQTYDLSQIFLDTISAQYIFLKGSDEQTCCSNMCPIQAMSPLVLVSLPRLDRDTCSINNEKAMI